MLRFTCDCGRVLGYEPQHVGKKVRCSGCRQVLVIPDQDIIDVEAVEVEAVEEGRPASRSRRNDEDSGVRAEREDDRPRKRSRRNEEEIEDVEPVEEVKRPRRAKRAGFFQNLGEAVSSQGGVWAMLVIAGL